MQHEDMQEGPVHLQMAKHTQACNITQCCADAVQMLCMGQQT